MRGVKSKRFHTSENVKVIWPVLHGQIGIGNMIVTYMFDTIDRDAQELALREAVPRLNVLLEQAQARHDIWTKSKEGGKLLKANQSRRKDLEKKLMDDLTDESTATLLLLKQKVSLSKSVDKRNGDIKNARKGFEEHKQKRKRNATSLYNIVKNLHKHGVERTSYHGGDFNGVTI